jgi:hypothetical protein
LQLIQPVHSSINRQLCTAWLQLQLLLLLLLLLLLRLPLPLQHPCLLRLLLLLNPLQA